MNPLFPVMIGGALGAGGRYLVGGVISARVGGAFPWGTLAVNLAGGLLMGLLFGWLTRGGVGEGARLFLGVGVLGGFTTFSAFGLDTLLLIERGQAGLALVYALASVAGAVALTALGVALVRAL